MGRIKTVRIKKIDLNKRRPYQIKSNRIISKTPLPFDLSMMNLSMKEKLEILNYIDLGLKGEKLPSNLNTISLKYAEKILALSKNNITRNRANNFIRDLNYNILKENYKRYFSRESEKLYKEFMKQKY